MSRADHSGLHGCEPHYHAVVIGGGPAGVVAASCLARRGVPTLMVEARRYPRQKVCGGCLNERAIEGLVGAGFGEALASTGASITNAVELRAGGRRLVVPTPQGLAVTRGRLDEALLRAAEGQGVEVWQGVRATVLPASGRDHRLLRLKDDEGAEWRLSASVVVVADGLGAPSLSKLPEFDSLVEEGSRVGCGALLPKAAVKALAPGHVLMAAGEHGYVGVVACEGGRLNAAAAFDANAASSNPLGELARRTLRSAGVEADSEVARAKWIGTKRLTQSLNRVAADRLLVIGDAAGYIEPFTGEGMAWGIEDAIDVAPLAEQGVERWSEEIAATWSKRRALRCQKRQRAIRYLSWLLRRPWAARLALGAAATTPRLSGQIARRISSQ